MNLASHGEVIGIDLSLTATGISDGRSTETIKPGKITGLARQRAIAAHIGRRLEVAALVVIEGPSYGSTQAASSAHERAGLWWRIVDLADSMGKPVLVVPPTTLKKFATGSGRADKDVMMLATARRFDWFSGDNNAADALWLSALGFQWLEEPIIDLPEAHLAALRGVSLQGAT